MIDKLYTLHPRCKKLIFLFIYILGKGEKNLTKDIKNLATRII